MTRPSAPAGTAAARTPRRTRITLMTAVVATVGLAACGTEHAGTGVGVNGPAGGAKDRPGTAFLGHGHTVLPRPARPRRTRLRMAGSAAGTRTVVDMCMTPATGAFGPGQHTWPHR